VSEVSASTEDVPVVFVHGWAGSFRRTWDEPGVAELVRELGRTVAGCDLPGHGESGPLDAERTGVLDDADLRRALVATIEDVLQKTGAEKVTAVGFSLGALTVLGTAVEQPHLFDRIVLAGTGDKVMRKHDTAQTERIIAGVLGSAEAGDVTARVFGRLARDAGNDPESLVAVLRRRRQPPYTVAELATLAMPVLVAIGDADFEYPATELVAAIPRASVAILPGVDHFRTPESFSFIDALLGFLSRQRVDG
jgi:pimeloyl-ACP methyl ester carboxylesterase